MKKCICFFTAWHSRRVSVGSTWSRDVEGDDQEVTVRPQVIYHTRCTRLKSHVLSALAAYLGPKREWRSAERVHLPHISQAGSNPRERILDHHVDWSSRRWVVATRPENPSITAGVVPTPHGVPGALRCQNLVDAHLSLGLSDESVGANSVASNHRCLGCVYWSPDDLKYVSKERFINAPLLITLQCLNYSNDGTFEK